VRSELLREYTSDNKADTGYERDDKSSGGEEDSLK
jgi:hypothetical protein